MTALMWISAGLLVLAMGGIGGMKLVGNEVAIEQAERLGYARLRIPIGIAEVLAAIATALAVFVGSLEWLGILAAAGVITLMVGALWFHLRVGDRLTMIPAIVVILAAVGFIVALT